MTGQDGSHGIRKGMAGVILSSRQAGQRIAVKAGHRISRLVGSRGIDDEESMKVIRAIVRGSIASAGENGADMCASARNTMLGVVRARGKFGAEALATISQTAHTVVQTASNIDANLGDVAEGAIQGATLVAVEANVEPGEAASAAAEGVLRAVSEIGERAIYEVLPVVKDRVAGVADADAPILDPVTEDGFDRGYV
jgi:hypothetical protein